MFTGIVEELGTVAGVADQGDAVRLTVAAATVLADAGPCSTRLGDSIAVNGCCLTVSELGEGTWTADVMRETLERTGIGALGPGDRVNLERAVTPQTRLGGHLVQGHIDGTGAVRRRTPSAHWDLVEITAAPAVLRYLVPKGSVAVDGVSLTVVDVLAEGFTVGLIPETLARTTLGLREPGDVVNLEVDVIAKYVEKMIAPFDGPRPGEDQ